MKTTIDLPESLLHRAKIVAAQRKTTLKELMVTGLGLALQSGGEHPDRKAALALMRKGFPLGGKPLSRDELYERR